MPVPMETILSWRTSHRTRARWSLISGLILALTGSTLCQSDGEAPSGSPAPTLKADHAIYNLESGVLDFGFTMVNPTDSVLFLDCQLPPSFSLAGRDLALTLNRQGTAGDPGTDLEAYPPQRIGAHQTFQGRRRFDHILGEAEIRPDFSRLVLTMACYPERSEGEGSPYVLERAMTVKALAVKVVRTGKTPPPPTRIPKRRLKKPI